MKIIVSCNLAFSVPGIKRDLSPLLMSNIKPGRWLLLYWWRRWNSIFAVSAFTSHSHFITRSPRHNWVMTISLIPHVINNSSTPSLSGQLAYYLRYLLSPRFGFTLKIEKPYSSFYPALLVMCMLTISHWIFLVSLFRKQLNSETPLLLSLNCVSS